MTKMNETLIMWLFGAIVTWNVGLSLTVLKLLIEQTKIRIAMDVFIDTMGLKLAKALHSPDDHLGLDEYLDKYLDHYYELSYTEWEELKHRCNTILADKNISKQERGLAGLLAAVCDHKLMVKPLNVTSITSPKLPSSNA